MVPLVYSYCWWSHWCSYLSEESQGTLGGYFFKWRTVLYFFLETGKRYRPNSFFIVNYGRFVRGWTFFRIRTCPMTSWWRNQNPMSVPMYFPYHIFLKTMTFAATNELKLINKARNELYRVFGVEWCVTWLVFSILKILELTWTGYSDDVIGRDRILKKVQPRTNLP